MFGLWAVCLKAKIFPAFVKGERGARGWRSWGDSDCDPPLLSVILWGQRPAGFFVCLFLFFVFYFSTIVLLLQTQLTGHKNMIDVIQFLYHPLYQFFYVLVWLDEVIKGRVGPSQPIYFSYVGIVKMKASLIPAFPPMGRLQDDFSCQLWSTDQINQYLFQWVVLYQSRRRLLFCDVSAKMSLFKFLCVCLVKLCLWLTVWAMYSMCLVIGAVCCLNKSSQSTTLKRTFIKLFHSIHLFLLRLRLTSWDGWGVPALSGLPAVQLCG